MIKLLKLVTGEMLISEVKEKEESYILSYPLVIVPVPPEQANGMRNQIGFMKFMHFSDYQKTITLYHTAIAVDSHADKQICAAYEKQVAEIKRQESGIVISKSLPKGLMKNGSAPKDFSELNL